MVRWIVILVLLSGFITYMGKDYNPSAPASVLDVPSWVCEQSGGIQTVSRDTASGVYQAVCETGTVVQAPSR